MRDSSSTKDAMQAELISVDKGLNCGDEVMRWWMD